MTLGTDAKNAIGEFSLPYVGVDSKQEMRTILSGEILFLVGANGTGKSTLMHKFAIQNSEKVKRITAHRQVWFSSNTLDLTPTSREQSYKSMLNTDMRADARWKDDYAPQRSQMTIFDLIDSENVEARKIASAARSGNMETVRELATDQSPLQKMNDILRMSNMDIQISVEKGSKILATRANYPAYSIAELSDGERNALLIVANVLTVPRNTLILLDEPERHLHRSIVSPLLSTLLTYRDDCAFVISTHDVSLPLDQSKSSAMLVRKYIHKPQHWVIDCIDSVAEMDEDVAESILGSRRIIIFIEGKPSSLDLQIYQILFPQASIRPVGSCVEVERVVKGLVSSQGNHRISALGIIDRDNRSDEECEQLQSSRIFPLEQYSVESIYYHPEVINKLLKRVASLTGVDVEETWIDLSQKLVTLIDEHKDRMAARIVQRKIQDKLLSLSPSWQSILENNVEISFSTEDILSSEKIHIRNLIQEKDIAKLISRYPVRDTQVLECVAKTLGFLSQEKYEQAVRKMLIDSEDERRGILRLLESLPNFLIEVEL